VAVVSKVIVLLVGAVKVPELVKLVAIVKLALLEAVNEPLLVISIDPLQSIIRSLVLLSNIVV
jgi:hypothetical protein